MEMDEVRSLLNLLNTELVPKKSEIQENEGEESAPAMPSHPLRTILIIKDSIAGHAAQSAGVAEWLRRLTGAEVLEIEIPEIKGGRRLQAKMAARQLLYGNRRKAREWLVYANGEGLIRQLGQWFSVRNIREGDSDSVLFISSGTFAAFFNIALGYIWRCSSATIMTPGVVGTALFDYAVVPEHDFPPADEHVLATLGAPNRIIAGELDEAASALKREYPPRRARSWGVMIGGDDGNYKISRRWVQRTLSRLLHLAQLDGVDVYITTSRRTSPEAELAIRRLANAQDEVRMLILASKDPTNPVPGMLGLCDEVFCTEDSVNMVSESITAGHRVILLRTERKSNIRGRFQRFTAFLVQHGLLPRRMLSGIPRFNTVFTAFKKQGRLIEFADWVRERLRDTPTLELLDANAPEEEFNEAKRAAQWILDQWHLFSQ